MEKFSVGDVVFVRFPFSDLSGQKLRPALLLAEAGRGDLVLCQITSQRYADERAIKLEPDDFSQGRLIKVSYIRPAKLFTANMEIVEKTVGRVKPEVLRLVVSEVASLLGAQQ